MKFFLSPLSLIRVRLFTYKNGVFSLLLYRDGHFHNVAEDRKEIKAYIFCYIVLFRLGEGGKYIKWNKTNPPIVSTSLVGGKCWWKPN
jgi:hypothetical protein